ncbi:Hypothetical predicted protein [Scomber scombrus]|uniref:Uncharacterized protein n=1 Tax=Scomber scombrus TaxID=13677 RepID=A0AAV1P5U4_SCOSC
MTTKEDQGPLTVMDFPPKSHDLDPTEQLRVTIEDREIRASWDIKRSSLEHCQILLG